MLDTRGAVKGTEAAGETVETGGNEWKVEAEEAVGGGGRHR